jgi:hypothetical protein
MSSALNVVQIEANRRNAQQSTGPRTEIGKKTSSLNALRHGLTSRIVVLPTEDLAAYKTFSEEFLASLAPDTFAERQYARIVARQADLDAAVALHNLNKMEGAPSESQTAGFVFKPEEIEAECRRRRRFHEARIAQECNYDPEKFRQQLAAQ